MRKLQLLGVAVFAVLAVGVLTAATASAAVTFLLAEWLVDGSAVGEGQEVGTRAIGTLLLEDTGATGGPVNIDCSGILLGTAGFDGLDVVSEVLTLSEVPISSTPLTGESISCEALAGLCAGPLVWPLHLPWNTLAELMEDGTEIFFVDLIEKSGAGTEEPGWEVECTGTLGKPVDECTGEGITQLTLENTLLLAAFSDAFSELAGVKLAFCSQSANKETGVVESIPNELNLTGSGTLSVSSEDSPGEILEA